MTHHEDAHSRSASRTEKEDELYKSDGTSPSNSVSRERQDDDKEQTPKSGRIVGGRFLEELKTTDLYLMGGKLKELEIDLPLTQWDVRQENGEEIILLTFVDGDRENPFNWSKARKGFITTLLCLMTLFIGLATTAYSSGVKPMVADLGASEELGQLGLFCFNFACALAPLFLAPFCELVGRRIIYVGSYGLFIASFAGLALGKNIATVLVCRALQGLFGCVGTILVGGTFGDIYDPDERALPMALFSYVAILGTVAAPVYAGFIDQTIGWRWIEGIQGLSNVPLFVLIVLTLRETRGGVALHKRAKTLRKHLGDERYRSKMDLQTRGIRDMLHSSSVKAVHMLVTEPVVFAFGLWIAFAWAVTFLFLSVIPITFQQKRGWSEGVGGLPYISLCIGATLGFGLHLLQIRRYNRIMRSRNRVILPESRLYGAMWFGWLLPLGLFVYSFTQYAHVHWIAPAAALAPVAAGVFFVFESCYSFTSDCYGENASSAIAGQGLLRNTLGGVAPLFAA
ncbi:hypothetical protein LTR66_013649, partial [Elasticomyces elasticus]